jgi:FMN-dependent oxidoreductase (nitrilotriacetate monooxygenase family)
VARSLHLNANIIATGRHAAAWRLPGSEISSVELDHFVKIAQLAERGKFDAIFVADYPGLHDQASHRPFHSLDPLLLMSAIAAKTTHIGLIATASTTFDHPYQVARRFASLDHISHGRASWNMVTSYQESLAGNFGIKQFPAGEARYRMAQEFVEIVYKLWDG